MSVYCRQDKALAFVKSELWHCLLAGRARGHEFTGLRHGNCGDLQLALVVQAPVANLYLQHGVAPKGRRMPL